MMQTYHNFGLLPKTLEVECCPRKSCSAVTVDLRVTPTLTCTSEGPVPGSVNVHVRVEFGYYRDNGDLYRDYAAPAPYALVEILRRDGLL